MTSRQMILPTFLAGVFSGLMAALAMILVACAPTLQLPKTIPVTIVAPIPVREFDCILPLLPNQPILVGWPTSERIYVTKDDMVGVMEFMASITSWAQQAEKCLITKRNAAGGGL